MNDQIDPVSPSNDQEKLETLQSERREHKKNGKDPRLKGGIRTVIMIALCAALLGVGILVAPFFATFYDWARKANTTTIDEKKALTILRNEEFLFLVTDRLVSQISVDLTENNPLLGKREGILIATVRMNYGIDMEGIDESCITRVEDKLIITLPPPRELDYGIDLDSLKYFTKQSGLMFLRDYLTNRDFQNELRSRFRYAAEEFFRMHGLIPSKEKILRRLNTLADLYSSQMGITVEFR